MTYDHNEQDRRCESRLRQLRPRSVPSGHRERILGAASDAAFSSDCKSRPPHRRYHFAWAALAACWIAILLSHHKGHQKDLQLARQVPSVSSEQLPPRPLSPQEIETAIAMLLPDDDHVQTYHYPPGDPLP